MTVSNGSLGWNLPPAELRARQYHSIQDLGSFPIKRASQTLCTLSATPVVSRFFEVQKFEIYP